MREAFLDDGKNPPRAMRIRACRLSPSRGGQAVFHFEGIDSINDAAGLVGCEVQVPLGERRALPVGSYYISDLVGCDVFEGDARLGRVRDVEIHGETVSGAPVLVVEMNEGELLIPLAQEICRRIDPGSRRIEVVLPEGLRELNREG